MRFACFFRPRKRAYGFTGCCYVTREPLLSWNDVLAYGNKILKNISLLAHMMSGVWTRVGERLQTDAGCYFDQGEKRHIMALCAVSMGTSFTHPAGARCANRLPRGILKKKISAPARLSEKLKQRAECLGFLYLFTFDGYKASRKTRNPRPIRFHLLPRRTGDLSVISMTFRIILWWNSANWLDDEQHF